MPEDKKRDPMPPPDATPEEIGEFWDTHSLADYWDETHEVEFEVNLKSRQNPTPNVSAQKKDISMSDEAKPDLPETTEDTSSTALDVVDDFALDSTIPAPIRRNAFKAFGQLCTAAIDWPVAYFEGKASEIRAQTEARIKIVKENVDQITQQMEVDPEFARIAVNKYGQKVLREQVNLDKISAIAADELNNSESSNPTNPETSDQNKEKSTDSTNQGPNSGEERTIDDDWLNNFETQARQVSTEEMQRRFGRVLAGEIEKPGSYSIKAVKLLGEIDQSTAALFKKLCSMCVVLGHLPSNYIRDARICFLNERQGKETLSKYGLDNEQLHVLEEHGLIPSSFYYSEFPYDLCIADSNNPQPLPFRHQERDWILVPLDGQKSQDFKLSGIAFSTVGRELFHIVDQDTIQEYTEALKTFLEKQKLRMVEVNSS